MDDLTLMYEDDDARIDLWNNGALDGCRARVPLLPNDPDYMEGYRHGQRERRVVTVMPDRPEGYYHAPLGAFD